MVCRFLGINSRNFIVSEDRCLAVIDLYGVVYLGWSLGY